MIIGAVILAPFYPLFLLASYLYGFLTDAVHLHSLFAGIGSAAFFCGGLYLLWKSATFRQLYIGCATVFLAYLVFQSIYPSSDVVWAAFLAILVLAAGFALTYAAGRIGVSTEEREDELLRVDPYFGDAEVVETIEPQIPEGHSLSYPLTVDQALELLERIDDTTFEVLQAALDQSPEPNLAGLPWSAVKDITGVTTWTQFARGSLARLNRELRSITGDPSAVLLLDSEKLSLKGDAMSNQDRAILMHGPVVQTLKSLL